MGLGRLCSRKHKHTTLQGRWTKWSQQYAPGWCEEFARLLTIATHMIKLMSSFRSAYSGDGEYTKISNVATTGEWPERPRCYLTGDLDIARQASVVFQDDYRMAPLHSDGASGTDTDPIPPGFDDHPYLDTELDGGEDYKPLPELLTAHISAEKQEEYVFYFDWLSKIKVPGALVRT